MDDLNRKLAEWAGLEVHLEGTPTGKPEMWVQLGIGYTNVGWIDFTKSLDACFKWLIYPNRGGLSNPPSDKIINWSFSNQKPYVVTYKKPRVWLSYCTLVNKDKNIWSEWQDSYAEDNSLALALCKAIEKLIE